MTTESLAATEHSGVCSRERPEIWLVAHGEELVAELVVEQVDSPWFRGRVVPRRGFDALAPLFDREQRLAANSHRDLAGWVEAYRTLRGAVRLIKPDGHEAPEFLLHVEGTRAWWRCSDQRANVSPAAHPRRGLAAAAGRSRRSSLASLMLALLIVAACPAAALAGVPRQQASDNWAGYAVTAHSRFASVGGQWVQPAATCDQPSATYSAFWIGLGGFKKSSRALEQIGTEVDCRADGSRRAFAWYELVPAAPINLGLSIRPGDRLAARVAVRGARVLLHIENLTTGRSFTRTLSMHSPDTTSAEWIAEAPSECVSANRCQPLPLTNFGTVSFSRATATTAGWHVGTITDPAFSTTAITLGGGPSFGPQPAANSRASGLAIPSGLSPDGSSFSVRFNRQPTPQPPPLLARHYRLRHGPPAASVSPTHRPAIDR